jgi:topoisomerase IA-like protein
MDTITLEEAMFLFTLPRVVGVDEVEMRLKQILEDLVHIYK